MRKFITALLIALSFTTTAYADDKHRNHRNDWVVPLISGIIIGNALTQQPQYQPQPRYYPQPVRRYHLVTVCEWVATYDRRGYYMGQQQQCWEEYQ